MTQLKTEYTISDRIIFYNKIYPELIVVQEDEYRLHNNEYRGSVNGGGIPLLSKKIS